MRAAANTPAEPIASVLVGAMRRSSQLPDDFTVDAIPEPSPLSGRVGFRVIPFRGLLGVYSRCGPHGR